MIRRLLTAALLVATPLIAAAAPASAHLRGHTPAPTFTETDLISDLPGRAPLVDPALVNPWGLTFSPTSPLWSANNGTGTAGVYSGGIGGATPGKLPIQPNIPDGAPTGVVFNDSTDTTAFPVGTTGPARFIFASESGDITAWNTPGADAVVAAHVDGAIYKGLAMLHTPLGSVLLAADFHNARIDVFDDQFNRISLPAPFFTDPRLPRGYAPFNVAVLGDSIYVTYAKQDADAEDEVDGPGLGIVDQYSAFGLLQRRLASHGPLNAPWGVAVAPSSFGAFAGKLLVGNFGDGRINVYDPRFGAFLGQLRDANGQPITIDGLWSLLPGTATSGGTDAVWFSAGIDDEQHGLVGELHAMS